MEGEAVGNGLTSPFSNCCSHAQSIAGIPRLAAACSILEKLTASTAGKRRIPAQDVISDARSPDPHDKPAKRVRGGQTGSASNKAAELVVMRLTLSALGLGKQSTQYQALLPQHPLLRRQSAG